MRIIDKNVDFYDYQQEVYQDASNVFDRTPSFLLTKQLICDALDRRDRWDRSVDRFLLLQICNAFWLFHVEITKFDGQWRDSDTPVDYNIELVATWKNYNKSRCLIKFYSIGLDYDISHLIANRYDIKQHLHILDKDKMYKNKDAIIQSIDTNNYRVWKVLADSTKCEKIPILKACGVAKLIDPLEIYLAFDEYFSLEKQVKERTASVGITDKEKIENHGFDNKTSFRGKNK